MGDKITVYTAAALFNGRETMFNAILADGLESKGYKTILPQRDGFEFGDLTQVLAKKLPEDTVDAAVQRVIYLLDMGVFVPKSDVILANLDEPLDNGVDIEAAYGKLIGKTIIGFRTDVRSPYGNYSDPLKGMHYFPAFQCDMFISHYMPCKDVTEGEIQMQLLVGKIDDAIKQLNVQPGKQAVNPLPRPYIKKIASNAKLLFDGIKDIHSEAGLQEIAERYIKTSQKGIGPRIYYPS